MEQGTCLDLTKMVATINQFIITFHSGTFYINIKDRPCCLLRTNRPLGFAHNFALPSLQCFNSAAAGFMRIFLLKVIEAKFNIL